MGCVLTSSAIVGRPIEPAATGSRRVDTKQRYHRETSGLRGFSSVRTQPTQHRRGANSRRTERTTNAVPTAWPPAVVAFVVALRKNFDYQNVPRAPHSTAAAGDIFNDRSSIHTSTTCSSSSQGRQPTRQNVSGCMWKVFPEGEVDQLVASDIYWPSMQARSSKSDNPGSGYGMRPARVDN